MRKSSHLPIMQPWQVGPVPDITYFNSNAHQNDMHSGPPHSYQQDMSRRGDSRMDFPYGQPQPAQPHHAAPVQPPMNVPQQPTGPPPQQQTPTPAPAPGRQRKRPAPQQQHPQHPQHQQQHQQHQQHQQQQQPPPTAITAPPPVAPAPAVAPAPPAPAPAPVQAPIDKNAESSPINPPPAKKSRTNTPWTPAEELRLKQMRDAGNSWAEIAKTFPSRTEGSVKKHWYKDMHYAEFAEDESQALLSAIKEYENNKWKTIGQKVGKPAKACEQYAKEHFPEIFGQPKAR